MDSPLHFRYYSFYQIEVTPRVIRFCPTPCPERLTGGFYHMSILSYFNRCSKTQAKHFQVGSNKRVILPVDIRGLAYECKPSSPHLGFTSSLCPLIHPYLQPAERLWPLVNEPLANKAFNTQGRGGRDTYLLMWSITQTT